MRQQESSHRIEQSLSVRENVRREMAAVGDMDDELQFAWQQLAMESALKGDGQAGVRYLAMAMKIRESAFAQWKLRLMEQAEARAKEKLGLDREKFEATERRMQAARDTVARLNESGGLTPEARAEIEKAMGVL